MSKTNLAVLTPTLYLAGVVIAVAMAIMGFAAPAIYILSLKIVFPVAISMIVSGWQQKNIAFPETQAERWVIYLNGIPVQEGRNSLTNVHFRDRDQLVSRLRALSLIRLAICGLLLVYSLGELYDGFREVTSGRGGLFTIVVGALATLAMTLTAHYSSSLYLAIRRSTWTVAEQRIKNTVLYSAYLAKSHPEQEFEPFLSALFGNLAR